LLFYYWLKPSFTISYPILFFSLIRRMFISTKLLSLNHYVINIHVSISFSPKLRKLAAGKCMSKVNSMKRKDTKQVTTMLIKDPHWPSVITQINMHKVITMKQIFKTSSAFFPAAKSKLLSWRAEHDAHLGVREGFCLGMSQFTQIHMPISINKNSNN